jgi:hypothetical protein
MRGSAAKGRRKVAKRIPGGILISTMGAYKGRINRKKRLKRAARNAKQVAEKTAKK